MKNGSKTKKRRFSLNQCELQLTLRHRNLALADSSHVLILGNSFASLPAESSFYTISISENECTLRVYSQESEREIRKLMTKKVSLAQNVVWGSLLGRSCVMILFDSYEIGLLYLDKVFQGNEALGFVDCPIFGKAFLLGKDVDELNEEEEDDVQNDRKFSEKSLVLLQNDDKQ